MLRMRTTMRTIMRIFKTMRMWHFSHHSWDELGQTERGKRTRYSLSGGRRSLQMRARCRNNCPIYDKIWLRYVWQDITRYSLSGGKCSVEKTAVSVCHDARIAIEHLGMWVRVFHKNILSKKQIVHTPTTPYRAYINHMQKLFCLDKSKRSHH